MSAFPTRPWTDDDRREFAKGHAEFLAKVWFAEQVRDLKGKFRVWHRDGHADPLGRPWVQLVAADGAPGLDERRPVGPVLDPTWGPRRAAEEIEKTILEALLGKGAVA